MRPPVFLTGATGFLGMEVLARLLEQGDREVIALVRARDDVAARERIDAVLAQLWRDPAPYRDRVRAVAGDVTSDGLGISSAVRTSLAEDVGAILHCAASISFDMPLDEARAINVEGTREIIGFARECKALGRLDRFVHVSTAYVSGKFEGTFRERQLDAGQEFRNTYEQTKWEAEHIVREATDLEPAIARPSIVMGESDSGWTPAFNVLYWPLRAFSRGMFKEVPALADGHVDVVPIDYVADALVHLLGRREAGVFNLVSGRNAPRVEELVNLASDWFGKPHPKLVEPIPPEHVGDDHGDVFVPYFDMRVVFDDSRARSVLGPAGIEAPILRDYFGRLMEYAEAARWGKRGMSREAARRLAVPA
jgi:thioester reductase-like protein